MANGHGNNTQGEQVVDADILEVLNFVLRAGGANADAIANATDEQLEELMAETPSVRIIFK